MDSALMEHLSHRASPWTMTFLQTKSFGILSFASNSQSRFLKTESNWSRVFCGKYCNESNSVKTFSEKTVSYDVDLSAIIL